MDISPVRAAVLDHASAAASLLKNTAIWAGRRIQSNFSYYLVPAINNVWMHSAQAVCTAVHCLQTSAYTSFGTAGTLFVISLVAFKISERHIYHDNLFAKASWKSLGLAALVASTVATSFGIAVIAGV